MKNLSPINDDKDVVTKEYVDPIKSQAALNRTTLGTQCKNLLNNTAVTTTIYGITFTVNDNGSVTLNGTSNGQIIYRLMQNSFDNIINKNCKLSGCPAGGTQLTYGITIYTGKDYLWDLGSGLTFNVDAIKWIAIVVRANQTFNNVTFKPMIRYADITDDTYEAYKESVDERLINNTSDIAINKSTLGYSKKNLFNPNAVNWYQPGKTSVASDGTVTATMTSDSRSFTYANSEHYITLEAGNYIITVNTLKFVAGSSALIRGCNSDNQSLFALSVSSAGLHKAAFSLSKKTTIGIMYKLYSQTCTIMIRDADVLDDTYEPYQPSVKEQIAYSLSVSGKSTSAAISYSGVPTLICLTPNTADSTAGGLYMINSAGAVVKLIEKSGVVIAADATSKTFTITNNTATVMDVCVSRCWGGK